MSGIAWNEALNIFVALVVIIDPIGVAPIFLALTRGMTKAERRRTGFRALAVGGGMLLLFAFVGEAVLGFIGISMPAFRIAGGILLFMTALEMLFERRTERRQKSAAEPAENDPSVFPLATPLIAGPGSITTVILLMGQHEGEVAGQGMVIGVMLFVLVLVLVTFLLANTIERILGRVGMAVVTRILGMLLAALSVQFVLDGLDAFGFVDPPSDVAG